MHDECTDAWNGSGDKAEGPLTWRTVAPAVLTALLCYWRQVRPRKLSKPNGLRAIGSISPARTASLQRP